MSRAPVLVVVVLVAAILAPLGSPARGEAAAAGPTLSVTPAVPMAGEAITLRTTLATRVARPARLERRAGTRWVVVALGRSTRAGRVTLAWRAPSARTALRVVAPVHRTSGRRLPAIVSRVTAVSGGSATAALQLGRDDGGRVDARVRVSHPRAGRVVELQERHAGGWTTLAARSLGPLATTELADLVSADRVRGRSLRVRLASYRGAPAIASPTHHPPSVGTPVVGPVTAGQPLTVTATASGSVERVRFYLDGVRVGEDSTAPYSVDLQVTLGRHDVVARAFGPLESIPSRVAGFDATAPPVGADTGVAEGFALETVADGLELPTSAASIPGGAVLVTEKAGRVKIVQSLDDGWSPPTTVLDLTDLVLDAGDAGLTGLAVDPAFVDNGWVYLAYVLEDDAMAGRHAQQVARYTWADGRLDPSSRHVVLGSVTGPACWADDAIRTPDCLPLIGDAHTVNDLAFHEGALLVGVGDGALYQTPNGLVERLEALRAQDPQVLAGKVLRVDPVTGRGLPGNPLHSGDGSDNASRVLAQGLRNPFRFTLRGDQLVVGDVGESAWEEVDVLDLHHVDDLDAGAVPNFGWPCTEGTGNTALAAPACADVRAEGGFIAPSYAYRHTTDGGSLTGGAFLDSAAYPPSVRGRYVFGDYSQMFLRTANVSLDGDVDGVADLADASAAGGPVRFFTGPDGLVWDVAIMTGSLRRIRWTGETVADQCPVGSFRRGFHDLGGEDSPFEQPWTGDPMWAWLHPYAGIQLPAETMEPPTCTPDVDLAGRDGDRFGTSWRGRVALEAGTWRFRMSGQEWMRLWVDNQPVHSFYVNEFWPQDHREHEVTLAAGQHLVEVEHLHGDSGQVGGPAQGRVTWERVGGPPAVSLTVPGGDVVDAAVSNPWSVQVSDPEDEPADLASRVEVAVDLLHYTGDTFHAHPSSRVTGQLSGVVPVDDVHAPGRVVVRLRARVTDSSGARSASDPVYLCPPGVAAGPCGG